MRWLPGLWIGSARTRRCRSLASPARAAGPRRSRWATCAGRSSWPTGRRSRATRACRGTAPRCATGRPLSPCTCCGGRCVEKTAPSSVRLFLALDLPEDVRAQLVEWQGRVFGGYGRSVRLVRPASLHVTLVFLGHHPPDQVDAIREAAFSRLGG